LEGSLYEKDFKFIVGEEEYLCPSFIAEFLSPRVSALRRSDGTISELEVELDDPHHYFRDIVSIGFGLSVCVKAEEALFFGSVCAELWNTELFDSIFKLDAEKVDRKSLLSRLNVLSRLPSDPTCDADVGSIASHFHEFSVSDCEELNDSILERILSHRGLVIRNEDSLYEIVVDHVNRNPRSFSLLEYVRFEYLSVSCMVSFASLISGSFDLFNLSIWESIVNRLVLEVSPGKSESRFLTPPPLESKIISSFPPDFAPFSGRRFGLLYRGSVDGFGSDAFHRKCDGHQDTVTIIRTTTGYIFGGYTPVAWVPDRDSYLSDDRLESFLFTIKNPHGFSPQIFRLKQQDKGVAICSGPAYGPTFGGGHDIYICPQCSTSNQNYANFGHSYENGTGLDGTTFLAGSYHFTVQELEVFELV
jgi:hypothetical protein